MSITAFKYQCAISSNNFCRQITEQYCKNERWYYGAVFADEVRDGTENFEAAMELVFPNPEVEGPVTVISRISSGRFKGKRKHIARYAPAGVIGGKLNV